MVQAGHGQPGSIGSGSSAKRALRMLIGPSAVNACPVPPGAGRQHAVEHVDAAHHRLDDVVGLADAHQVARLVGGQHVDREVEAAEHRLLPLADRQPADRIAVEADVDQRVGRCAAQPLVERALLDAEHRGSLGMLAAAVEFLA